MRELRGFSENVYQNSYLPCMWQREGLRSLCAFEAIDIETSILVWWYILTIARSSLSIRSWSRSSHGKYQFGYLDISLTWLKVKVINAVNIIPRSNCKCLSFYWQVGGERPLYFYYE